MEEKANSNWLLLTLIIIIIDDDNTCTCDFYLLVIVTDLYSKDFIRCYFHQYTFDFLFFNIITVSIHYFEQGILHIFT